MKCQKLFNCICTVKPIVCLVFTHAIEIARVFCLFSKYVACFNKFSAGKDFCEIFMFCEILSCCVVFELNKFAYVC